LFLEKDPRSGIASAEDRKSAQADPEAMFEFEDPGNENG
jgi:hypothetical protein